MLVGGAVSAALFRSVGYIAGMMKKRMESGRYFYKHCYCCHGCSVLFRNNFAPQVVSLIGAGFETDAQKQLTVDLIRILFPSVAFLMMADFAMGF